jgi:hypothetical protein
LVDIHHGQEIIMATRHRLAVLMTAVFLSGCATLSPQSSDGAFTRSYAYSQASVWRRIISTSAQKSMFVRQADASNGLIMADRDIIGPGSVLSISTIYSWADCGWSVGSPLSQHVEVNYLVRAKANGVTTVTLNARFQERRMMLGRPKMVECSSTGVLERELLDSLYYDHPA